MLGDGRRVMGLHVGAGGAWLLLHSGRKRKAEHNQKCDGHKQRQTRFMTGSRGMQC